MNGTMINLFALLLVSLPACRTGKLQKPQEREGPTPEATQEPPLADERRVDDSPDLPPQARGPAEESLYSRLLSAGHIAVFCDNRGLYAIGGSDLEYVLDEPCSWLTIDYGSGILWFDRAWSKTHERGLFMVNLAAAEPVAVKFGLLQRSFEIWDSQGMILPMTEGSRPDRISMLDSPITLTVLDERVQCGPECVLSEQVQALGEVARTQYGTWHSPLPILTMLAPTPGVNNQPSKTIAFPPGRFGLELRGVRLPDHPRDPYVWQLFDLQTSEYIDSMVKVRSKRPRPEGQETQHLMVCEEGYLIVGRSIYDWSLRRLEHQSWNDSYGVCLTGGALFVSRWLLARSGK